LSKCVRLSRWGGYSHAGVKWADKQTFRVSETLKVLAGLSALTNSSAPPGRAITADVIRGPVGPEIYDAGGTRPGQRIITGR
jgi:hypothetical protein